MTGKTRFAAGILAVSLGVAPFCRAVALSIPERAAEAFPCLWREVWHC